MLLDALDFPPLPEKPQRFPVRDIDPLQWEYWKLDEELIFMLSKLDGIYLYSRYREKGGLVTYRLRTTLLGGDFDMDNIEQLLKENGWEGRISRCWKKIGLPKKHGVE